MSSVVGAAEDNTHVYFQDDVDKNIISHMERN